MINNTETPLGSSDNKTNIDKTVLTNAYIQAAIPRQAKTQSVLNNRDRAFGLKNLSGRSELIVNRIVSQLSKRGERREGQLWVKIPAEYFAKALKLTKRATFHHIKKLKEEKLLISQQFDKERGDMTNYYTIDIGVMTSQKFEGFFCTPIVKKLLASYKGFISPYGAIINPQTSQNKSEVMKKIVVEHKTATTYENKEPASSPSATTVQDMRRIWQEETGRKDKLNKRLARFMVACLQKVFKTLDRWREYVKSLCRSTYITENMFSKEYFLKWVLSFKVIQRILDGGFGIPTESQPNQITAKSKLAPTQEERKKKSSIIDDDTLDYKVLQIYKRYDDDREVKDVLAKFIEFYGKYEAVTAFGNIGNTCINLKGSILRLYFHSQFWLDRFMEYGRYDKFIKHCKKIYDFKCCAKR